MSKRRHSLEEAIEIAEEYWFSHNGARAKVREDYVQDLERGWLVSPQWLEKPKKNVYIGQSFTMIVDSKTSNVYRLDSSHLPQQFQIESFRRHGTTKSRLPPAVQVNFDRYAECLEPGESDDTEEQFIALERKRLAWFDSNRDAILNEVVPHIDLDNSRAQQMMDRLRAEASVLLIPSCESGEKKLLDAVNRHRFLRGKLFRKGNRGIIEITSAGLTR